MKVIGVKKDGAERLVSSGIPESVAHVRAKRLNEQASAVTGKTYKAVPEDHILQEDVA